MTLMMIMMPIAASSSIVISQYFHGNRPRNFVLVWGNLDLF